jgi:hypothetical protein
MAGTAMYYTLMLLMVVLLTCCYAMLAGRRAGLFAAPILLASNASSNGLAYGFGFPLIAAVDVICFLLFWLLAVRFQPKWIVYCGGLQFAKLATHIAAISSPHISAGLYEALQFTWSLLMIAAASFGIWTERRRAAAEQS